MHAITNPRSLAKYITRAEARATSRLRLYLSFAVVCGPVCDPFAALALARVFKGLRNFTLARFTLKKLNRCFKQGVHAKSE